MKMLHTLILSFVSICAFAQIGPHPRPVTLKMSHVYIPKSFDDNDNVQVVFEGNLPSTCYRFRTAISYVEENTVFVRAAGHEYPGIPCLPTDETFFSIADLGPLKSGDYQVIAFTDDENTTEPVGSLHIGPSKGVEPDDFFYAPIHSVDVLVDKFTGTTSLELRGIYTDSCHVLMDVKINIHSDVIEVLPITEVIGTKCTSVQRNFRVELPMTNLPVGRYLFHVRSYGGSAMNLIKEIH